MGSTANAHQPAETTASERASLTLAQILETQRKAFREKPYTSATERKKNLDELAKALIARKEEFAKTLHEDFGCRNHVESLITDVFMVISAIKFAKRELHKWMKPRKRVVPIVLGTGTAYVLPQPVGVVGIVAPWNFPLNLSLGPLVTSLAAGNRTMIKPSEHVPQTSALLQKMIEEVFDLDHVAVVTGDADVGKEFVHLPFDHLLFTGSTEVGRYVMKAAAENLTPVTLELGGKSPALVAPDADLNEAAIDIAFGKVLNAGQICIAPDYALVQSKSVPRFIAALKTAVNNYYPSGVQSASEYTAVVNDHHHKRLSDLIEEARLRGVQIVSLSEATIKGSEIGGRKIAPIAIVDPPEDLAICSQEIFGPVLLIKPYETLDDAVHYINERPRPLALYLFSKSKQLTDKVLRRTISGGVSVNDVIMHNAIDDLPFGGIGASGIGHYHGREGFDTFSKLRPVFERIGPRADRMLRPPFKQMHRMLLNFLISS